MKKIFMVAILFPAWLHCSDALWKANFRHHLVAEARFEQFARAIIYVESRGDSYAIGRDQDIGKFQITPILLEDYMRRTGEQYELGEMCVDSIAHRIFRYYSKGLPFQVAARRWNGGPRGECKPSTLNYWVKVNEFLHN